MANRDGRKHEFYGRFFEDLDSTLQTTSSLQGRNWHRKNSNRYESNADGFWLNFVVGQEHCRVQLYIEQKSVEKSWEIYREVRNHKDEIAKNCGEPIDWTPGKRSKKYPTIEVPVKPDAIDDETQWDAIQSAMIAVMVRFDAALADYLQPYRASGAVDLSRKTDARREAR